jgi:glycosyltransferase involved in cell wall biosynthesis
MNHKKVSIIIPTFNRADVLAEAIRSCLAQSYPYLEVIVMDDGSTDNTAEMLTSFEGDERLIYRRLEKGGISKARNNGLAVSRGDYIQFLDSDDLLHPNKFQVQIEQLETTDNFGVYCHSQYFKGSPSNVRWIRKARYEGNIYTKLLQGNFVSINSMLFRKTDQIFDERLPRLEDWYFWLQLAEDSQRTFGVTDQILCYVRVHESNATRNTEEMAQSELKAIDLIVNSGIPESAFSVKRYCVYLLLGMTEEASRIKRATRFTLIQNLRIIKFKFKQLLKRIMLVKNYLYR